VCAEELIEESVLFYALLPAAMALDGVEGSAAAQQGKEARGLDRTELFDEGRETTLDQAVFWQIANHLRFSFSQ
jgi:hypothetical protein